MRVGLEIAGRYRLTRELGRGAFGEVWEAEDRLRNREVAIKFLRREIAADNPVLLSKFRQEARIAVLVEHEGITQADDFGEYEGQWYLVMEFLDGRDLAREIIDHPTGMPVPRVVLLGLRIAEALAAAHAHGVVHRDLKPANIMLIREDRPKICDFGIAHLAEASTVNTLSGRAVGTPAYMAPEQWLGRSVDARTDLYAFGAILYNLLTGRMPFSAGSVHALMGQHLNVPAPSPATVRPGIPTDLEHLIEDLLEKDPVNRPDTAEVVERLRELCGAPDAADPGSVHGGLELAGRYHLDRALGGGSFGEVWKAHDHLHDRAVAVKFLKAEVAATSPLLLSKFRQEARIGVLVGHPGITRVDDFGEYDGQWYLVMELLDGRDLAAEIAAHPAGLPVDRVLGIGRRIAEALAAAHDHGIVHRDLKPANVMLLNGDRTKICDFGIAHLAETQTVNSLSGQIAGTPAFMAPEQWLGRPTDARTDLYALGGILFSLLTGAFPFNGTEYALMGQHLNVPAPSPRVLRAEIPEKFDHLVLELLAKAPDDRPSSTADVADRLRLLSHGRPADRKPAPAPRQSPPPNPASSSPRPVRPAGQAPRDQRAQSPAGLPGAHQPAPVVPRRSTPIEPSVRPLRITLSPSPTEPPPRLAMTVRNVMGAGLLMVTVILALPVLHFVLTR